MTTSTLPSTTENATTADPTLDLDAWAMRGPGLLAEVEQSHWVLAEWFIEGVRAYGLKQAKAAALKALGAAGYKTLRNYAVVGRAFADASRRRDGLSFAHHAEVAKLATADADLLLDKAQAEGLTTRQLRAAARQHESSKGTVSGVFWGGDVVEPPPAEPAPAMFIQAPPKVCAAMEGAARMDLARQVLGFAEGMRREAGLTEARYDKPHKRAIRAHREVVHTVIVGKATIIDRLRIAAALIAGGDNFEDRLALLMKDA